MNLSGKEKNNRILAVDDESDVLGFLKTFLEPLGWEVTGAASAAEALAGLDERRYFLVLSDIAMPEMDGYELISTIRQKGIASQILLMTGFGYNPNHTLIKLNRMLKLTCLFKPFDRAKVAAAVAAAWQEYNREFLAPGETAPPRPAV